MSLSLTLDAVLISILITCILYRVWIVGQLLIVVWGSLLQKVSTLGVILLICSCCSLLTKPEPELSEPFRLMDAPLPKGCLLWALKAKAQLPTFIWKRVLIVIYEGKNEDGTLPSHAYCIFMVGKRIWAYDTLNGSKSIHPDSRSAEDVMKAADKEAVDAYYLEDKE